ncbi:MAG: rRNA maturation RNase YbeY [Tidjanibacter sp.]|nr:rRNA maturation RNase YbeY [Tidjanibacter sp.]
MAVRYFNEECTYLPKGRVKITAWVRATIHAEGFRAGDVSYIYCSPAKHLEINQQYLGHDYYTDVITFDYSDLKGTKIVSGDIFIDPRTVADNAETLSTDPRQEELRVIIHGVLHLCGYKDKSPKDAKLMRQKENFYLQRFE